MSCWVKLTGRISKVCSAPEFRVMASPSAAASEAANRHTVSRRSGSSHARLRRVTRRSPALTQVSDLQRDLDRDLQRRQWAGDGTAAAAVVQPGQADLERGRGGTAGEGRSLWWCHQLLQALQEDWHRKRKAASVNLSYKPFLGPICLQMERLFNKTKTETSSLNLHRISSDLHKLSNKHSRAAAKSYFSD